eukprot:c36817_g1_i1.p1 GENE.c36817_g1_i1~~c36817_g1_i1.p1  ORF type:complete len:407 (+),score=172.27 c36817_g1_i1:17-1237(+)
MHSPKKTVDPLPAPIMKRYWPGKAPVYSHKTEQEEYEDETIENLNEPLAVSSDSRLQQRLQVNAQSDHSSGARRRVKYEAAEVIEKDSNGQRSQMKDQSDEEDESAILERRRRAREKARLEEEILAKEEEEEEEEDEESESSEYETDSDEDDKRRVHSFKPVYVPKSERETIAEREKLKQEEEEAKLLEKKRLIERKKESHHLLLETVKEEEELERVGAKGEIDLSDVELPDTDDDADAEKEYAAWKVREIKRIKREQDEKEMMKRDREEVERRRNLTEAQRREEDAKEPKPEKKNGKMRYLQKYYHKGVFYNDDEDIKQVLESRDFNQPTLEDLFDKTKMPEVLQVKNFGRAGQTKWTHLAKEDTTNINDIRERGYDPLATKYQNKMGGMNRPLQRPKGRTKRDL